MVMQREQNPHFMIRDIEGVFTLTVIGIDLGETLSSEGYLGGGGGGGYTNFAIIVSPHCSTVTQT